MRLHIRKLTSRFYLVLKTPLLQFVLLAVFIFFLVKMWSISLSYFPWNPEQGFLVLKQDVVNLPIWKLSFQWHALSTLILCAGLTQFSQRIRRQWPDVHRAMGWMYVVMVLCIAAPSGLVLAVYALGGWTTRLCFLILGLLWIYSTVKAVTTAKQGLWGQHRAWMIRSFALSLSALTLRTWKLVLYEFSDSIAWLTPLRIYQIEAWLGWVVNILIAEWWIWQSKR